MPKQAISWKIMETFTPMVSKLGKNFKALTNRPKRRGRPPNKRPLLGSIVAKLLSMSTKKKKKANIVQDLLGNIGKTMDKLNPGKSLRK